MKLSKLYTIERCQTEKLALKSLTVEIKLHWKWKTANLSKQKRKLVNLNIDNIESIKNLRNRRRKN